MGTEEPKALVPVELPCPNPSLPGRLSLVTFLRQIADDLESGAAVVAGTDFTFERMRIRSLHYDLFLGRYDPEKHRR